MVKNLKDLMIKFSDEVVCREHLIKQRWPDGNIKCQYCGHNKCYRIDKGERFKCANNKCYKRFRVTVGTIFEASNIPLTTWFPAMYLIMNHKKGISSCQLARDLSVTQKTAWFMLHRIREQLKANNSPLLSGTVELDETFVGGIVGNMNKTKRAKLRTPDGGTMPNKTMVVGMVERGGELRMFAGGMSNTSAVIQPLINNNISPDASLITDEARTYNGLNKQFHSHEQVNHSGDEYVRNSTIHTNTIEGAFSLLKRSIIGIYHFVSPKHLSRYCDETTFRYNTRKLTDPNRFIYSFSLVEGRLKYKDLIADKEHEQVILGDQIITRGRHHRSVAVIQMKDGKELQTFPSIVTAALATGINRRTINNVLKGKQRKAGGYNWKYA